MTKQQIMLVVVGVVAACASACERKDEPYGGREAVIGSPEYSESATNAALIPAAVNVSAVSPKSGAAPDGNALYAKNCAACHQVTGQGIPGAFPPLDASPYVLSDNVERIASIMLYGLIGPIHVNGTLYNNVMTPFGSQLKDEELAAVATHIRSSWSNKAAAVQPEAFAAARKKWGARGPFNISELGEES